MNITLIVPPAIDWSMPLLALPLLKKYLPSDWNVKILDINAKLFNSQFGQSNLTCLKEKVVSALERHNLQQAVDACLDIEECILAKQIGSSVLEGRSLYIIDDWFDSNKVFEFLKEENQLLLTIKELLVSSINEEQMEVFGISISIEEQIVPSFMICKILRTIYPKAKIILGGNIVSRLSNNLLKSKLSDYFDLLLVGEGEAILQEAIEHVTSMYGNGTKIYCNGDKKRNIFKQLRTPDFSDICLEDYMSPIKVLPITVQRRCKWGKCDFCSIHASWTYGQRERNVGDVVDEIENLMNEYNVRFFRIVDEMVSADYLFQLSSMLLRRNITIYYEAYVRFEERFLDEEYMKTIFDGGCRQLFWGLENINNRALEFMNKGITTALIGGCLDVSGGVGITNYCFILMGIPEISVDTEQETLTYACNNRNIHVAIVGSFVVDKLSPIHIDEDMHKKYHITLFDVGDLTTEVGYLHDGVDIRKANRDRTATYIKELYSKRVDYAICSLLSEEARLILTATFGNSFVNDYITLVSEKRIRELVERSIANIIEERVTRRIEET